MRGKAFADLYRSVRRFHSAFGQLARGLAPKVRMRFRKAWKFLRNGAKHRGAFARHAAGQPDGFTMRCCFADARTTPISTTKAVSSRPSPGFRRPRLTQSSTVKIKGSVWSDIRDGKPEMPPAWRWRWPWRCQTGESQPRRLQPQVDFEGPLSILSVEYCSQHVAAKPQLWSKWGEFETKNVNRHPDH